MSNPRYTKSLELHKKALERIPLASQTFSKSTTQFPYGVTPLFIEKGDGSYVWDVDGNQYVDMINSLAAITLGYADEDVNEAVAHQLEKGSIFSLSSELEQKVAEQICELVPCAEMVRFGKNGSDATAGAVRIARAATKKDHTLVCGYHGWQDWYIGSTPRNLGVPESTQALTHTFPYNDLEALEKLLNEYKGNVACVIMEPMNVDQPADGYLQAVKDLTRKHDCLLVFDEMITGFRYSMGGGQELLGVTPDLATFGKGLANGFPISAIAGSKEYMKHMEDVFFSFTFGGETLSLAAAHATLTKLQNEPVIETIYENGLQLKEEVNALIKEKELGNIFEVVGYPAKAVLRIQDTENYTSWDFKTLYMQELCSLGVLSYGNHIINYCFGDKERIHVVSAYNSFFDKVTTGIEKGNLHDMIEGETLKPLFEVRGKQ